jgi:SnoaL-like protein
MYGAFHTARDHGFPRFDTGGSSVERVRWASAGRCGPISARRPAAALHGGEQIAGFYRALLGELRIDRFEPVRRWYGADHVVDEAILHATAVGQPFGLEGRGRPVHVRFLHIFDFVGGLISRESAWMDVGAVQQQLA